MLGFTTGATARTPTYTSTPPVAQQATSAAGNGAGGHGGGQGRCRLCSARRFQPPPCPQRASGHGRLLAGSLPSPGAAGAAALPLADAARPGQSGPRQRLRDAAAGGFARRRHAKGEEPDSGCRSHSGVCGLFYTASRINIFYTDLCAAFSFQGAPAVKEQNHTPKRNTGGTGGCSARRVPVRSQEPPAPPSLPTLLSTVPPGAPPPAVEHLLGKS